MAASNYNCSLRQGLNFEKDVQTYVAYINSLSIGGTPLTADMTLTNPTDVTATVTVVGVITQISWEGGYAAPLLIGFNVSTANQKQLAIMVHTDLTNTDVVISFTTWAYDLEAKLYYPCFHTNDATVNGLILTQGGSLYLQVASEADSEVPSPPNFQVSLGIMPQNSQQALQFAVSNTDKFAKQWGVTVGGT